MGWDRADRVYAGYLLMANAFQTIGLVACVSMVFWGSGADVPYLMLLLFMPVMAVASTSGELWVQRRAEKEREALEGEGGE